MSHQSGHPPLKMGLDLPNGKLGMWLFLGTEIMFFTAFIGSYIVLRIGSPGWPQQEITHINVIAGAVNTFVLICSSVSVVLALEGMQHKNFNKARKWLTVTLLLAFVFLGIKSFEYYGKFSHGILPGKIPETERQALMFTVHDLRAATGIDEAQFKLKRLELRLNDKLASGGNTDALQKEVDDQKEVVAAITPMANKVVAINDLVSADKIKLGDPTAHETHTSEETATHAAHAEGEVTMVDEVAKLHEEFPDTFGSVHVPAVIPYGNLFASSYFVMTGFHALHVLVGMLMFVVLLGYGSKLGTQHTLFVENSGLYWHFVDLVWIFLFPLIYIV